eukprot:XP_019919205.1 PREDICTED: acetyl-CoA carboxylase 1-like [Crassostrea gigas]
MWVRGSSTPCYTAGLPTCGRMKIAMVQWLTEQIREDSMDNAVSDNIRCLQREHVLQQVRSLIQDNPEVAMDSIVHITQHMTPSQRSEVTRILANMDM